MIASAKDTPTTLRMPAPLRRKVEKAAVREGRSLNSEIVIRLLASFGAKTK